MDQAGNNTTGTPRLSIGLPVYNADAYLEEALDSLLGQTYRDFELVISDNASTDRTEDICREYARRDSRVRYFRQSENRGANWNFNEVFRLARGELFKWAAYDDLCDPTLIEKCVALLDRDPDVVGVQGAAVEIDARGQRIDESDDAYDPAGPAYIGVSRFAHARFGSFVLNHGSGTRSFGVIRSAALARTGLYRNIFGWEKVIMAELGLLGKVVLLPERLFSERVHDAALSQRILRGNDRAALTEHYDGRRLPRLEFLKGFASAAYRSAPGWASFFCCLAWLVAYTLQVRKLAHMCRARLATLRREPVTTRASGAVRAA